VRNLCLDWHRKEFGRERVFESIGRLSALDQAVFRCIHQDGISEEHAFLRLRVSFPQLTHDQIAESSRRVERLLSPRQRWLLSVRAGKTQTKPFGETESEESPPNCLPASSEDPESVAISEERRLGLARAISRLPAHDRLLIRLRYDQELTLAQIAELLGLNGAQNADRRVRQVLERLREQFK
jgi:RNA polymerase sigma factor (sigma-70 family)